MVPALQVDTSCENPVRCSQCPTKVRWSSNPAILLSSQSPICEGPSQNERGVWSVFRTHHTKFSTGGHQCWKSCGVHGYGSIEQRIINAGDHKIWKHSFAHYCMMSNGNPAAFIATISPGTRKPYSITLAGIIIFDKNGMENMPHTTMKAKRTAEGMSCVNFSETMFLTIDVCTVPLRWHDMSSEWQTA